MICCAILALLAAIPAAIFGRSRKAKHAHCAQESTSVAEVPGD
jgi:hypothetical protein